MSKSSLGSVVENIEEALQIPAALDYSQSPPTLICKTCDDCSTLSCGCLVSENLGQQLSVPSPVFKCPSCGNKSSVLLKPCENLRFLARYLTVLKAELKEEDRSLASVGRRRRSSSKLNQGGVSLLSAFHEVFNEVSMETTNGVPDTGQSVSAAFKPATPGSNVGSAGGSAGGSNVEDWMSMMKVSEDASGSPELLGSSLPTSNSQESSHNSLMMHSSYKTTTKPSNLTKLLSTSPAAEKTAARFRNAVKPAEANREKLFGKNFPFYRKLYQYHTHHTGFLFKSKLFINTGISPNLSNLVLLSEKKWEVYKISTDTPERPPQLFCCGKNSGEYGPSFEKLQKPSNDEITLNSNFVDNPQDSLAALDNWEHLFCKITDNLLVISGTRGFVRVLDLNAQGRVLYTYQSKFPIRCIDVSPDEQFVSLGVTGKDKYVGVEQAFIILLRLQFIDETNDSSYHEEEFDEAESKPREFEDLIKPITSSVMHATSSNVTLSRTTRFLKITTFPFTLPYRDPISIVQFSPNSKYLSVATALESRFMVISIVHPTRPVLVMKSQRKLDTSLESEGITDVQFFPDNKLMTLTSVSYNSVPIIIDTKITSISGPEGIARPRLLLKLDEVGHTIHKCCVSPRGDSIAYLDRSGSVFLVTSPQMDDNDNKRIVVVTDVSNAYRVRESASMRFDKDGYKLYILDRKGILTISDFTAGTVEDSSITRCKIIS